MRTFKLKLLALPLALAALQVAARAADVQILGGPILGHVTDRSARVWIQLNLAGELSYRVIDIPRNVPVSGLDFSVDGPSPFIGDVPLNNLEPDHSYRLEALFEGQPLALPGPPLIIRTAPAPGDQATFSVAFGSDLYTPPAPSDGVLPPPPKPGTAPIFKRITDLKPRAFFFLGDTGFLPAKLDEFPPTRRPAFRAIWENHSRTRRVPDLQELFRTTPSYALYNDRDFGPIDADHSFPYLQESNIAFQRFWPNADWGTPEHPGCFSAVTFGDVEFFFLDTRTYRVPATPATATAPGTPATPAMLGDVQLEWLETRLKSSKATFKILAAPCPLFSDDLDSWKQFAAEQASFTKWLADNPINGLVAIAGNRPAGELTRLDASPVHYPLFTLGCSTLNDIPKTVRTPPMVLPNPQRQGEPVLQNNFGTLDFGGQRDHRFITLRLRDDTGKIRIEQTLFATQLRAP